VSHGEHNNAFSAAENNASSGAGAIYSIPFGRLPVIVQKTTTEEIVESTEYSTEVARRLTSADTKPPSYHEYDEIEPQTPPSGGYEYADPNATGKWSLQHIARGTTGASSGAGVKTPTPSSIFVECEYATIPAEDSDGDKEPTYTSVEGQSVRWLDVGRPYVGYFSGVFR